VPNNLKGRFSLRVLYDTEPFDVKFKTGRLVLK